MSPLVYSPKPGQREQQLASQTGLKIVSDWLAELDQQYLFYQNDKLVLGLSPQCREHPVCVDFEAQYGNRQRGKELLLKAIGGRRAGLRIVDATAGLGRDSFLLASYGAQVQLCERHPVVAAMLADGLQRAQAGLDEVADIARGMQLSVGSALDYLKCISPDQRPDIIYLDPMFPDSGKSALVKKEMRLFHGLVGLDEDENTLLAVALDVARYRVVVKRPAKAPVLGAGELSVTPQYAIAGKAVRFDVYPLKAFAK